MAPVRPRRLRVAEGDRRDAAPPRARPLDPWPAAAPGSHDRAGSRDARRPGGHLDLPRSGSLLPRRGLDRVLAHSGFDAGPGGPTLTPRERRPGWRHLVVATAADGFLAVFTCAEVMPEMGPTQAFVVWSRDGGPLPPDEGP